MQHLIKRSDFPALGRRCSDELWSEAIKFVLNKSLLISVWNTLLKTIHKKKYLWSWTGMCGYYVRKAWRLGSGCCDPSSLSRQLSGRHYSPAPQAIPHTAHTRQKRPCSMPQVWRPLKKPREQDQYPILILLSGQINFEFLTDVNASQSHVPFYSWKKSHDPYPIRTEISFYNYMKSQNIKVLF